MWHTLLAAMSHGRRIFARQARVSGSNRCTEVAQRQPTVPPRAQDLITYAP
jgi:hypothetical protein